MLHPDVSRVSAGSLTQTFLTGVVGTLPLALAVLVWLVNLIHDIAGPNSLCGKVLTSARMSVVACDKTAYVIGLVGAFVMVLPADLCMLIGKLLVVGITLWLLFRMTRLIDLFGSSSAKLED